MTKLFLSLIFQSALPRGERPGSGSWDAIMPDFNPRSREGSDLASAFNSIFLMTISIRAPARGATYDDVPDTPEELISIRAPARGATTTPLLMYPYTLFQSALPRGERQSIKLQRSCMTIFQSALPRGERQYKDLCLCSNSYFNPRSREGSDFLYIPGNPCYIISIRAPARGATILPKPDAIALIISIRAPARGATSIFAKKFSSFLAKIV